MGAVKDKNTNSSLLKKAIRENSPLLIAKQLSLGETLEDIDLFHALDGQTEALKFLLDKGLNPDVLNDSGNTLLFYITEPQLFEFALSRITNINHQNGSGDTILHHLVATLFEHKSISLIDLCLQKNPDLSLRNQRGQTVLLSLPMAKAESAPNRETLEFMFSPNYFMVIDKLLASGSSIAEADPDGNTLIHHMCKSMRVDNKLRTTVEAMVQRGAPINIRNNQGISPLDQLLIRIDIERSEGPSIFPGGSSESNPDGIDIVSEETIDEEQELETL